MGQLATIEDYFAFRGETYPPTPAQSEAEELAMNAGLERATDTVKGALRLARYTRAADGLPSEAEQRSAITRAVAAQYAAIGASGGDLTGAEPVFDQVSAIGVQFSRRTAQNRTWGPLDGLAPEAAQILMNAGFFSTAVRH